MKKIILSLMILIFSVGIFAQKAKKFAIESGYVKMELSGDTKGIKEIWWEDFGNKYRELEKSKTETSVFGFSTSEEKHMLTIIVKDKFWTIDYLNDEATKGKIPYYQDAQNFANSMTEEEQKKFSDQIINQMGGSREGKEKVKGYNCDVISIMGAKTWVYKGVALKMDADILGVKAKAIFTEFKPDTKISSSLFTPPGNINFNDVSSGMNGFSMDFDDEEEEEEETIPVNYPYDKFKKVVNSFSHSGYKSFGTNSIDGIHAATFINGNKTLMIVAESRQNSEKGEHANYETFNNKGKKCFYGKLDEEDGTAIIIEYPNYDMHIIVAAMPEMKKEKLLSIVKKLKF